MESLSKGNTKMFEIIKYEITVDSDNEEICITDCPYNQIASGNVKKVGSYGCAICIFQEKHDYKKHEVNCNFQYNH